MPDNLRHFKKQSLKLVGKETAHQVVRNAKMSLDAITYLCEQGNVVCAKVQRGRGHESSPIIAMTFDAFKRLQHDEAEVAVT